LLLSEKQDAACDLTQFFNLTGSDYNVAMLQEMLLQGLYIPVSAESQLQV
jgi:hypothetical protein